MPMRAISLIVLLVMSDNLVADDVQEICSLERELAEIFMVKRQQEYPLSWLMETNEWEFGADFDWVQTLVLSAYETPRFETVEKQQAAIEAFGRSTEVSCYRRAK